MAIILEGRQPAEAIIQACSQEVIDNDLSPKLKIITVGNDEASKVYVRNKKRVCERVGIQVEHTMLNADISRYDLYHEASMFEHMPVLIQFPLPEHLISAAETSLDTIPFYYDVDGLGMENKANWDTDNQFIKPCTALGIMKLLEYYNIPVDGKDVCIIGRSNLVGKPLAAMMTSANATVTLCHSHTANLAKYTRAADIVIVAVGKPDFLSADLINGDCVVIDVGINRVGNRLTGDCSEDIKDKAKAYTPVPGGVGLMTTAMAAYNTIKCYKESMNE